MNRTANKTQTGKKTRSTNQSAKNKNHSSFARELSGFIIFLISIYLLTCAVFSEGTGALGVLLRNALLVAFGPFGSVAIPAAFTVLLFFGRRLRLNNVMGPKVTLLIFASLSLISAFHLTFLGIPEGESFIAILDHLLFLGPDSGSGGVIGGFVALAFGKILGRTAATVILSALFLFLLSFVVGYTGSGIWSTIGDLLCIEHTPKRKKTNKTAETATADPLDKLLPDPNDISAGYAADDIRNDPDYVPFEPHLDSETHTYEDLDREANFESDDTDEPYEYVNYSDTVEAPEEIPDTEEETVYYETREDDDPHIADEPEDIYEALDREDTKVDDPADTNDMNETNDIYDANEDADPFEEEQPSRKRTFGKLIGKRKRPDGSFSDGDPETEKTPDQNNGNPKGNDQDKKPEPPADDVKRWIPGDKYAYPPTSLLNPIPEKNSIAEEEVKEVAQRILRKLLSLKVKASLVGYSIGPTITRYELAPGEGVRVNKISQLIDDISLELASDGVRIEAPIPGKAAVGIEVPNKAVSLVSFRELAEDPRFTKAQSKITVCVGKNLTGGAEFMDIDDMPHVLIAGQTKSGKSVAINCMILSFLFRVSPDEVKLILIDPKRVEFNIYSKLPHLVMPVIDEPTKAAAALSWAVNEMERRYDVMKEYDARHREEYLMKTAGIPDRDDFPQIVIIIDELADLMLQVRDQVDPLINRLAAKARACGIHLLVGTQRPSADVLTGLIKANIPGRISFKVAEQVDARIIGAAGAEKLLGKGDMLYRPTGKATVRVQGAFVDGNEINRVIDFVLKKNGEAYFDPEVMAQLEEEEKAMLRANSKRGADEDMGGDPGKKIDPLLMNAIEIAVENQSISTSSLQRFLEVGYGRGAKLIDTMERLGIVGPPNGSKPREVYMTMQQFHVWKLEQQFDG